MKRRQKFRPFAPAILEEYADEYFEGNEYMQFVATKHDYASVTHVDGTLLYYFERCVRRMV